nr:MAG TPA: hypothetical protein [Caudoviricetes sp.]
MFCRFVNTLSSLLNFSPSVIYNTLRFFIFCKYAFYFFICSCIKRGIKYCIINRERNCKIALYSVN